ncbi:hypothetical protein YASMINEVIRUS_1071 [Yasminevirus sp. GU-2018]|uniref:Uncharacterized protein n=1 Tax=Yasminevirus sp. GU-2018 TaxID=2420051 RepID=A0A5K0U9C1_9VIRU|nr:hypothetical protein YASMINEVIRUS_1071 [Yasminevirus sp. GU-2018]
MNFLIGAIGANLTLGLVSGVTSAVNGVYTLSSNIMQSTSSGANEVKQIIKETDLEVKVKTAQLMLCELKIDDDTPYTVKYCVQTIRDAIKDIGDELEKIYYRMQYNDNLWVGSTVRSYKFHNCRARLHASLKNLESRCDTLMRVTKLNKVLVKNENLTKEMTQSVLQVDDIDPLAAERVRGEIHKKLMYINKNQLQYD